MSQIKISDFSAGWIPSDNDQNGRKNGLLKMVGVTLDDKGVVSLAQGTSKGPRTYASKAHTLFSRFVCGGQRNYVALEDGSVWRDGVKIIDVNQGSKTRAAFGTYKDFVMVFSGDIRIKDTCQGLSNTDFNGVVGSLGIRPPTDSVILNALNADVALGSSDILGTVTNFIHNFNATTNPYGLPYTNQYGQPTIFTDNGKGSFTADIGDATPSLTNTAGIISADSNVDDFVAGKDFSGSLLDTFEFDVLCNRFNQIKNIQIAFWLDKDARAKYYDFAFGSTVNIDDAYWCQFDVSITPDTPFAGGVGGLPKANGNSAHFSIQRSDFFRFGVDTSLDWSTVHGVSILVQVGPNTQDGVITYQNFAFNSPATVSGIAALTGTYEYVQLNVQGGVAFSDPGPISDPVTVTNGIIEIIPQDPTLIEPSADAVWIFRRGQNLDQFYRIAAVNVTQLGPIYDYTSDVDAINLDVVIKPVQSVSSSDLNEDILEIVGPIYGRMIYFSATKIYFSEIEAPDNFNPAQVMDLGGNEAELFLWARKVSENVIVAATTQDLYILTGTFQSFPDGSLDVVLRNLGVDRPPICRDVVVYKGSVVYFVNGWQQVALGSDRVNLCFPSTELLYTGVLRYEFGGVPTQKLPEFRYSVCEAGDKLYCVVPYIIDYADPANESKWGKRLEIYDFNLKYWRVLNYSPDLLSATEEGAILGFRNDLKRIDSYNYPFSKLLNQA